MTQHVDGQLTHPVDLSCVDQWGRTVTIPTTLGYHPDDPFAVSLTFQSRNSSVTWHASRTLLLEGLATPAGEGDIHIFPSIDEDARAVTVLVLSSPDGRLLAELPSDELQSFLTRTFDAVPMGAERDYIDIDGLVEKLLADA